MTAKAKRKPATKKPTATYGRFKFRPVVFNDASTWIAAIWTALDLIDWNSEDVQGWISMREWPADLEDEVKTAMAWLEEHLGIEGDKS